MTTLPEKLLRLCEGRGWDQADFARAVGLSPTTVGKWFNGKSKPSLDLAYRASRALGVELGFLADDDLDEPPGPELTEDERAVVRLMRDLRLDRATASRGLAMAAAETRPMGTPAPGTTPARIETTATIRETRPGMRRDDKVG